MLKFNVGDRVRLDAVDETGFSLPPIGTEGIVEALWDEGDHPENVPYPYWIAFDNDPENPHLAAEEEIEHA